MENAHNNGFTTESWCSKEKSCWYQLRDISCDWWKCPMAGHDNGEAVAELGEQWPQILHAWFMNCQNTKQQKILNNENSTKFNIQNNELGGQCHQIVHMWLMSCQNRQEGKGTTKYQTTEKSYNNSMFNSNWILISLERGTTYELGHFGLRHFAWWGHNKAWS